MGSEMCIRDRKNNSFTCCARQADEVLRVLQQEGATEDESVAETLEQEGD